MTMTVRRSTFRASLAVTTAKRGERPQQRRRGLVGAAAAFLLCCLALAPGIALAQAVRTIPGTTERALDDARERLGRDPGDVAAMRDAVQAAMRLGQIDMAAAYARRAQQLAPGDAVITASRGAIEVHRGRPREALQLFAQADRAGVDEEAFVADRALAYDLIGDQPSAQYYYALAQRFTPDDEVLRRYALSLAIIGDYDTGEAMLRPLLNVEDPAAWRMHAFMLAISGQAVEARRVLNKMLPSDLALQLGPYMDAMPRLSRAQQAAAANLGLFPALPASARPGRRPM